MFLGEGVGWDNEKKLIRPIRPSPTPVMNGRMERMDQCGSLVVLGLKWLRSRHDVARSAQKRSSNRAKVCSQRKKTTSGSARTRRHPASTTRCRSELSREIRRDGVESRRRPIERRNGDRERTRGKGKDEMKKKQRQTKKRSASVGRSVGRSVGSLSLFYGVSRWHRVRERECGRVPFFYSLMPFISRR